MAKPSPEGERVVCRNRKALHDYDIHDRIEAGLVLVGTEVKSLRVGHAVLEGAFAAMQAGELWLMNSEIPEYIFGNRMNHAPKRPRKLLLHRREVEKFAGKASEKGFTLVPLAIYFKQGRAKVELAIARGKQAHDKRDSLKRAESDREIRREQAARRRG